jgi:hypothetical protein
MSIVVDNMMRQDMVFRVDRYRDTSFLFPLPQDREATESGGILHPPRPTTGEAEPLSRLHYFQEIL